MVLRPYQEKKLKLYMGWGGNNTLEISISTHPQTFATFKVHSVHSSGTVNIRGVSSVLHELTVHWEGQTRKQETIMPSERRHAGDPSVDERFPQPGLAPSPRE